MIIKESLLFLNTAFEDCGVARTLYDAKFYSQSIYSLIQAVEKTCKYYAIRNQLLSPDELKSKIGHNSISLFKKLIVKHLQELDNQCQKSENKNLVLFNEQLKIDFTVFEKLKPKDLINITKTELAQFVQYLDSLDNDDKVSSPSDFVFDNPQTLFFFETPESLIQSLIEFGIVQESAIKNLKVEDLQNLKSGLIKMLKLVPKYQKTTTKLILLTTLFSKNINETRYPDIQSLKIPSDIFNENHALVGYIPPITNHISSVIDTFLMFNNIKI